MEIIVVTRADYFDGEAELINLHFENEMEALHIRKPENDSNKFRELMINVNPAYYDRIAIHQHHQLADEYGLKRLHFPERQRKLTAKKELGNYKKEGFTLSSSIHDLNDLADLKLFDYVFYGPVFNSISKPGYLSKLSTDFRLPLRETTTKIIAIGGITFDLVEKIEEMDFDGAAICGAAWPSPLKQKIQ